MDNTQQASFYSTLSDSSQTASHHETAASENGCKYFWVVLWGEKSQPSSSALTLKEGDGSLWSTESVQLDTIKRSTCREWLTFLLLPCVLTGRRRFNTHPTFFSRIHPGPRLQLVQNMQGEGGWQMAKASQQSVKANGLLWLHAPGQVTEPSEIRLCSGLQGRSNHIWKIQIAHLMVF